MAKLIMWNLMTLDGFVEGPNRDISWHLGVWGAELEQLSIEQLNAAGGLLFGRVTCELIGKSLAERDRRGRRFHECRAEIRLLPHDAKIRLEQHADVRR